MGGLKASCVSSWVQSEPGGLTGHGSLTLKNGPGVTLCSRDTAVEMLLFTRMGGYKVHGDKQMLSVETETSIFLSDASPGDTSVSSGAQALQGGSPGVPLSLQRVRGLSWGREPWSQICRC